MRPIFVLALRLLLSAALPTLLASLQGCAAHQSAATARAELPRCQPVSEAELAPERESERAEEIVYEEVEAEPPQEPAEVADAEVAADAADGADAAALFDPVSEAGQRARGLYLGGPYLEENGVEEIVELMRLTRMNAAVIDLKDGQGRLTYQSQAYRRLTGLPAVPESEPIILPDPAALVRALRARGIYTIARIVAFSDRRLPRLRPERAVMHSHRPEPWGTNGTWLDPYNEANHRLVIGLAREAERMGFDEVQLDYIRFPVEDGVEFAVFPAQDSRSRAQMLTEFLRDLDLALHIPLGVDVFGLTAFHRGHRAALGQELTRWAPYVEIFAPMLYMNSMRSWAPGRPHRARTLIQAGVSQLRERIGPLPVIRPYLQAFSYGVDRYDPPFIYDQVIGARRGGADGMLFWHPGSVYGSIFSEGIRRLHDQRRFPIEGRLRARREAATEAPTELDREEEGSAGEEPPERELARAEEGEDLHAEVEQRNLRQAGL